ncbi:hypothetical protein MNV_30017 [Candidatus Methanoperedens nitroreducens]|uniref:Adenosine monophosphate-protein transferase n=1 Tax=Candidatus Methanoperedens nitratireducens TaxID=1392998 RepID=A0A284VPS7_9EURY|nr:hypothetical protein MNV_30017 [Candidatus Methanoperedens nitroreducens]
MELIPVKIDSPPETNLILGQTHFIKSAEDLYEALISSVPGIKFGLASAKLPGSALSGARAMMKNWKKLRKIMRWLSDAGTASLYS